MEWTDDSFTSLRVRVPKGTTYRITYSAINKSNVMQQEPKMVITHSSSKVVKDIRPDCFYTILVEAVPLGTVEHGNGRIGIGE